MRPGPGPGIGRLTRRSEFLAAAGGRRFHSARLSLQALRRDGAAGPRVGFTITKRVGHATERNRIRRRLRDAVGRAGLDWTGEPVDLVVVGRRDALGAPFEVLVADLQTGFRVATRVAAPDHGHSREKRPGRRPKPD